MKSNPAIGAIVCAGIATSSLAQTASFIAAVSTSVIFPAATPTFTVDIFATADFGTHISGGAFALDAIDGADSVVDIQGSADAWAAVGENNFGYDGMGNHAGLVFGQVVFPPFFPPAPETALAGGPVHIASFQYTIDPNTFDRLEVNLTALASAPFSLEIYNEADGTFTQISNQDIGLSSFVVQIPAPSGLAILGLGALTATRRRR